MPTIQELLKEKRESDGGAIPLTEEVQTKPEQFPNDEIDDLSPNNEEWLASRGLTMDIGTIVEPSEVGEQPLDFSNAIDPESKR